MAVTLPEAESKMTAVFVVPLSVFAPMTQAESLMSASPSPVGEVKLPMMT